MGSYNELGGQGLSLRQDKVAGTAEFQVWVRMVTLLTGTSPQQEPRVARVRMALRESAAKYLLS